MNKHRCAQVPHYRETPLATFQPGSRVYHTADALAGNGIVQQCPTKENPHFVVSGMHWPIDRTEHRCHKERLSKWGWIDEWGNHND